MVNEQPGARAQRAALESTALRPGRQEVPRDSRELPVHLETRAAQRPGPAPGPSVPPPPPWVCRHQDLWAALGRVSVGFTSLIILFNRLLQPLRQCGPVSSRGEAGRQ